MIDKRWHIKNDRLRRILHIYRSSALPVRKTQARKAPGQKARPRKKPTAEGPALYTVKLSCRKRLDGETATELATALEDLAAATFLHNKESTDGDNWTVTLTVQGEPDRAEILRRLKGFGPKNFAASLSLRSTRLPAKDWLRHVHDHFPPVRIGKFYIRGSHIKGKTPAGLTPLHIDAATAFGSGEHATTRGCLLAFEKLSKKKQVFRNALDMGCGSGILGIAMTRLWPGIGVLAVDIDPESVAVTRRHAEMNRVRLVASAGDGYAASGVRERGLFDLIAANILAGPLIAMAPDCRRALARGGFCVLSGLLRRQKSDVAAAYEAEGLVSAGSIAAGDWQTLIFRKSP
jgi:ribosomal protein L11 methyltransferase